MSVLGGEENLPPKLPEPDGTAQQDGEANKEAASTKEDPFSKLQSVDGFLEENREGDNWWDAKPQIPKAVSQTPSKPTVNSFTSQGETHFEFDPRRGEPASLGIGFSPFGAVTKFCYKFVKKGLQQPIATAFFDENKIWNREWDM